ncbi:MAG: DinB family protein [Ignavibacteriales bacterium]|nr:MAG: DinB family protein [Ignavibacteriales bacterium]
MQSILRPLHIIFVHNSRLLKNAVYDVNDELAERRLNNNTNSIKFILCHLIDARYHLANLIGLIDVCPFRDLFDRIQTIEDFNEYPQMNELNASIEKISLKISTHFEVLEEKDITKHINVKFPIEDRSVLGGITFLLEHESYHIGQIGFIRKYYGLHPLKYY